MPVSLSRSVWRSTIVGWVAVVGAASAWAAEPGSAIPVPVHTVQQSTVGAGFELDGLIQPVKQSTVSAQTAGRIVSLLVKAGDVVRAGQLLATIDEREALVGAQRSQAQLAQAQADWRVAQANLTRNRELQAKGFVSQAALDIAESQAQGAQAGRDQAQAGMQQAALARGYSRILAPYDGRVQGTDAQVGDLAVPGKPLLTVYAPLPLRVVVQVPGSRSQRIGPTDLIEVRLGGQSGQGTWVQPTARTALPSTDPVAQTVEWRLDLSTQAAQGLVPGQQIAVRFVSAQPAPGPARLLIPAAAVLRRGELTAVYVASERGFLLRAVRLGTDHAGSGVEVLAGLKLGERIALDPVKAGLAGASAAAAR
ncbi:efflux RND transporter periplasmic adaptor subunit [Rhodoferax sp.]|uniref:efflux RND transporter periplasmic adaptor subunit n=1 Tax=Rhodoferax sp. TaxID=50421 RepID=UPI00274A6BE3|nr:efflux RND transporter periplasmic adaptor subunit [Rhodoferax sp.]